MTESAEYADRLLAGALGLAAAGVAVFPVRVAIIDGRKDVRPIAKWREASTTDLDMARQWFGPGGRWHGASVAIDCGKSALVVVDADGAAGIRAWDEVRAEHRIGETYRATTPGAGRHDYFRADPLRTVGIDNRGRVAPGIDIRGAGGFALAPPSRDARGVYGWVEGEPVWSELPVVPTVIVERMTAPRETRAKSAGLSHRGRTGESTRPPGSVHPYVAATFAGVVDEFAAITSEGSGRSGLLAGAALRLSKFANAHHNGLPATGLTEEAVKAALLDAADRNGFAAAHGERYTVYQVDRGIEDGRDKLPKGWPPPERTAPNTFGMTRDDVQRLITEGWTAEDVRAALADAPEVWDRLDLDGLFAAHAAPSTVVPVARSDRAPLALLAELLAHLRVWLHLPDSTPLVATMAVAVTAEHGEGDPPWLLITAAPASGKSELVRLLDGVAARRLDDLSVGGLLTWTRGRRPRPTGLLASVHRGLVTFGDLSALLAGSDHGGRDQVFALLRRVHDGEVNRDVAPPSGAVVNEALHWRGRVQVVGATTSVIDRYSAHNAALGDRWLLCRLPERDSSARGQAARLCRARELPGHRDRAMKLAAELVHAARSRLTDDDLPDELFDTIVDGAQVAAYGRASVPRSSTGRREIEDAAIVEEPMRLVRQLSAVAVGLRALGLDDDQAATVCRRLAVDSMPAARRGVLAALADAPEPLSTAQVGRASALHWHVASRRLEELAVVGVVESLSLADDGSEQADVVIDNDEVWAPDRRVSTRWRLAPDVDDLFSRVLTGLTCVDISHETGGA